MYVAYIITAIMGATTMIRRHLPLITGRLVFTSQVLPSVPTITPRIDFDMELPSEGSQVSEERGDDERDDERDGSLSELSAIDSDDDDNVENHWHENSKIPKPVGEAGRPHSGGYNLKEVLGWPKTDFDKIQVIQQELARRRD
jgi:hypothetical protein